MGRDQTCWPLPVFFYVFLLKMLRIGPHTFSSSFCLAPLAGYTDLAFRLLCRQYGAGYCVSEMISCHGLVYQQENTLQMLQSVPAERPTAFQLFGADPEIMTDAAQIIETYQPEMLDINMGCPVKKVTKRGSGAALMTTPSLAEAITSKIVKRVNIPVTVKIRAGRDNATRNAVEFAKMLEGAGAAAITVHGRTWSQGFSGFSDPSIISQVKTAIRIPVIGNGDVTNYTQGLDLMTLTGCDGVMIGRGALGSPWVFSPESNRTPKTMSEICKCALQHLQLIESYLPAERMLGYVKSHISRYFKGLAGSSAMRKQIFEIHSLEQMKTLLRKKIS